MGIPRRCLALLVTVVLAVGVLAVAPAGAGTATASARAGLGSYVVVLDDDADGPVGRLVADVLEGVGDGVVTHTYRSALRGFAVTIPHALAPLLRLDPRVASVEPDRTIALADTQKRPPSWGLDRIDQERGRLDRRYTYPRSGGRAVHVYVIDTGLAAGHSDFRGRVRQGRNWVGGGLLGGSVNPDNTRDCNGHGTHVASTAVGTRYGVAKRAVVHPLRVLDCDGSGTESDILAAIDWVAAKHAKLSVVNISIGTGGLFGAARSNAIDRAVQRLVSRDVAVAVAAGNDDGRACATSPAAASTVLTVAATDRDDDRASFSNFGSCVDLFAPGVGIRAADYRSKSGSVLLDGTSMASPHVAGALALLRREHPGLRATQVQRLLVRQATRGVVRDAQGSPNRLLYVSPEG